MIRGLYTSASGMLAQQAKNDVSANNLANVNTTGFKKDNAVFRAFPEMLVSRVNDPVKGQQPRPVLGSLGTGVVLDEVVTDQTQGSLLATDNPFNLALAGEGYFVINRGGADVYTRNGDFGLDPQGYLVNNTGDRVQGQKGNIRVEGKEFRVNADGTVWVDEKQIDVLRVVSFMDPKGITKVGDSYFTGGQPLPVRPNIKAGFLETSNVNPVTEMVNLITIMRGYETNQKAIQAHDQTLDKAVNEVGRV